MGVEDHTRTRMAVGWEVHQATGTVIAQTSCSADEALERILEYAHSSGASVDQVAEDILADRLKLS
ncbi:MAG: ANTAR domain-containing protein [Microterricola sp.]